MAATNQGQQAEHEYKTNKTEIFFKKLFYFISRQCVICFDDILPNQPIGQCSQCVLQTHRNCLLRWLITRQQRKLTPNCPYCRADMSKLNLNYIVWVIIFVFLFNLR